MRSDLTLCLLAFLLPACGKLDNHFDELQFRCGVSDSTDLDVLEPRLADGTSAASTSLRVKGGTLTDRGCILRDPSSSEPLSVVDAGTRRHYYGTPNDGVVILTSYDDLALSWSCPTSGKIATNSWPSLTVSMSSRQSLIGSQLVLRLVASEGQAPTEVWTQALGQSESGTWSVDYPGDLASLRDGNYSLELSASSPGGEVYTPIGAGSCLISFDRKAPTLSFESKPIYRRNAIVRIPRPEGAEQVHYRLVRGTEDSAFRVYDDGIILSEDGSYALESYAIDAAGNRSAIDRRSVHVDHRLVSQGWFISIDTNHRLVHLGHSGIMDWVPSKGSFRLWNFQPHNHRDPIPDKQAFGSWTKYKAPWQLVHSSEDRVIWIEPNLGLAEIWRLDLKAENLLGNQLASFTLVDLPPDAIFTTVENGSVLLALSNASSSRGSTIRSYDLSGELNEQALHPRSQRDIEHDALLSQPMQALGSDLFVMPRLGNGLDVFRWNDEAGMMLRLTSKNWPLDAKDHAFYQLGLEHVLELAPNGDWWLWEIEKFWEP